VEVAVGVHCGWGFDIKKVVLTMGAKLVWWCSLGKNDWQVWRVTKRDEGDFLWKVAHGDSSEYARNGRIVLLDDIILSLDSWNF
jgi:hypothetical protein